MRELVDHHLKMAVRSRKVEDSPKKDSFCITADLLIPGRGQPQKNACLIVTGSKISHVGPVEDVQAHFSHLHTTHVKVLMPGMWDCHAHLMGIMKVSVEAMVGSYEAPVLSGARVARDCELLMNAGFTSVSSD